MATDRNIEQPQSTFLRLLLILCILATFARLTWQLDAVNLWWDESLSLERAQSPWPRLLSGRLDIEDGTDYLPTYDQHPFVYFVGLRLISRLAGISEFSLRFPSVMAATLLTPAAWVLARYLARRDLAPAATPLWSVLLAAVSPYYLWYGQEVRMYTLWALLALLSSYVLLRWSTEADPVRTRRLLAGYVLLAALLLGVHYFSVFLLPVHAAIIFQRLARNHLRRALLATSVLLGLAGVIGLAATWWILRQPHAGKNFTAVDLDVLIPDLLNSFSMGLSVPIDRVWWLDLIFGAVAVGGMIYGLATRRRVRGGGWFLVAFVLTPPLLLWLTNLVLPSYMNSRHMSLVSGAFLLAVAVGLGWIGLRQRWVGTVAGAFLVGAMIFANVSYFRQPELRSTDYAGLGSVLSKRLLPGDMVLLYPPELLPLYRYYLPIDDLENVDFYAPTAGSPTETENSSWHGVPSLVRPPDETIAFVDKVVQDHRRIWYVRASALLIDDPDKIVDTWFEDNAFKAAEFGFASEANRLNLHLYLSEPPVYDAGEIAEVPNPIDAVFGDQIRLRGYEVGRALSEGGAIPVSLYWEPIAPVQHRYKYILTLVELHDDGSVTPVAVTEREPYDGAISTIYWQDPGKTIVEYTEVLPTTGQISFDPIRYQLQLQMYDAETLEKLPLTQLGSTARSGDPETLILPYLPE